MNSICSSQHPILHLRVQFQHPPNPIYATNLLPFMLLNMEGSFPLALAIMNTCSELGNSKLTFSFRPQINFKPELNHCASERLQHVEQWSKHACRNLPFSSGFQALDRIRCLTWEMLPFEHHDKQLCHWES